LKTPNLRYAASLLLAGLLSCGTTASNPPKLAAGVQPDRKPVENASPPANESALAIVNASDRSEADKKLDPGRHPAELLSFFRIGPGMRVAETDMVAAIRQCHDKRLSGELKTYAATSQCSGQQIIQAFTKVNYRYMDLITQMVAKQGQITEQLDRKKISEADANVAY